MRFSLGDASFCRAEECVNRKRGCVCPQSSNGKISPEWLLEVFRRDPVSMLFLRDLLVRDGLGTGAQLSDATVAKLITSRLISGRLRICQKSASTSPAPITGDPAQNSGTNAATEKPFPLAARSRNQQKTAPAADQSLFPGDVGLSALADALLEASISGVPFCEECLRAQLGA